MKDYTHLNMRDRCLIATFLSMKTPVSTIAQRSNRHRSTIYREIKRNRNGVHYMPGIAHEMAIQRHPGPFNKIQVYGQHNKYVVIGVKKGWSPEQISGRMKREKKEFYASPESIYRYVYRNKSLGLYKLLPAKKPKRRSRDARGSYHKRPQMLMRHINLRTKEADLRQMSGHWEGDTIRFPKDQKTCVTTLVERKSRYLYLRKNTNAKSKTVMTHIYEVIKSTPKKIWQSLALDQGNEFMDFRTIERQTKCKIYFCEPHSPWQRGSNENMNGRLRRFLPKKFKIDRINQEALDKIAMKVNNTPRKCLGYLTPEEVFKQALKASCRTPL